MSIVFVILGGVAFFRTDCAISGDRAADHLISAVSRHDADVVAATVVTPIEQQINGVENLIYMRVEFDR